ncbi:MAG: hypothetical protein OXK80_01450 [Bdellovibrionales bacterium]|nr:hypothetical protein [Bdellovibrionales bacterium]
MYWIYKCLFYCVLSVFFLSCGKKSTEDIEPGTGDPGVPKEEVMLDTDPLEFTMIVHDEYLNESDSDEGELLGGEKFFVVQQKLSNGSIALFIADDHTYSAFLPDGIMAFLGGDTFADKSQERIKSILLDYGNSLKTEVCQENTVGERRKVFMEEGLTKGTLALITPGNTWVTYMNDTLSDGFFDGYQVAIIEMDGTGFVEAIYLSKYGRNAATMIQEGSNVDVSLPMEDRTDFTLKHVSGSQVRKSAIDLSQYITILEGIRGADGRFSSCSQ